MRDRSHDEVMSEQLNTEPAYTAELIADVLRNGSPAELDIFLRQPTYAAVAHDQNQRD